MDKAYTDKYLKLEETNWWFMARKHMILSLMRKYPSDLKILEVGCSGGMLIKRLDQAGFKDVVGIDICEEAVQSCIQRGIDQKRVKVADAINIPSDAAIYDLLIASDVLEHIEDDEAALREWNRVLKPDGYAIIFVPAYNSLFGRHDMANRHFRRYTRTKLKRSLEQAGFNVVKGSYWNISLLFPVGLYRIAENIIKMKNGSGDHLYELNHVINKVLYGLLRAENHILNMGVNAPFGVSIFCVAQKKR